MFFIRSAVNINEPFRTLRNRGFLPARSRLISFATRVTSFRMSCSLIETVNFLSFICMVSIRDRFLKLAQKYDFYSTPCIIFCNFFESRKRIREATPDMITNTIKKSNMVSMRNPSRVFTFPSSDKGRLKYLQIYWL